MKYEFLENKLEETLAPVPEIQPEDKAGENLDRETPEEHTEKMETVHHWVDEIFSQEQERLAGQGFNDAKSWIKSMAAVDRALSEHPRETLGFLAQVYGISYPMHSQPENEVKPEIIQCLQILEQNQKNLWSALEAQSAQTKQLTISNFAGAKDEEGNLLHPYFPVVKDEMMALLSCGIAYDFENAYEKALWINPQTRAELIEKQESQVLQTLAEEADKAKTAGFFPSGGLEKEDFSQMTTREILEHNYKKLED